MCQSLTTNSYTKGYVKRNTRFGYMAMGKFYVRGLGVNAVQQNGRPRVFLAPLHASQCEGCSSAKN